MELFQPRGSTQPVDQDKFCSIIWIISATNFVCKLKTEREVGEL